MTPRGGYHQPSTVEEITQLVTRAADSGQRIRVVGAGHSFTPLALGPDTVLNLDNYSGLVGVTGTRARFLAGTRLHQIPALLQPYNLALANQGDVDPQALAGAISTGTHGTGLGYTGFAGMVTGLTLLTASGEILELSTDSHPEIFDLARLSLGVLGTILEVELECVPRFDLVAHETVEPFDELVDSFIERAGKVDHTEFYWFPGTRNVILKTNQRISPDAESDAKPRSRVVQGLTEELIDNAGLKGVVELGMRVPSLVGPLNNLATRLAGGRSYRAAAHQVFVSPRRVRFTEMEYALPLEAGPDALKSARAVIEKNGWPMTFPFEVRVARHDDVPLSTAYQRDSMYIAVHRYVKEDYAEVMRRIESVFRSFDGRPHWGKLNTLGASDFQALYPRFDDFVRVRAQLDPQATFGNRYTDHILGV